jgi:hypothetical protein
MTNFSEREQHQVDIMRETMLHEMQSELDQAAREYVISGQIDFPHIIVRHPVEWPNQNPRPWLTGQVVEFEDLESPWPTPPVLGQQHVKDYSNNPFADIVEWLESEEGESWSTEQNCKRDNPLHFQERCRQTVLGLFNLKDGLECVFCTSDLTTPGPSTHPERNYTSAWGYSTDQDGAYRFAAETYLNTGTL